jgi:6-phosphofructokinase 1
MRIGVLTGGGDCPGLNAVIRAVVRKGVSTYGHEFVGFRDGWRGPLDGDAGPLGVEQVRGILPRGGTILGTSRTNPYKVDGGPDRVKAGLAAAGVEALIAIGGEDTLGVAKRLYDDGVQVVGVPKTIDNDVSFVQKTFGFETAVAEACRATYAANVEAEGARNGIGLVKLMGRDSGFIAAYSVLVDGQVNFCLIPEVPFTLEKLLAALRQRLARRGHAVIVVAEGAGQDLLASSGQRDASGNVKYGDIGAFLRDAIVRSFKDSGTPISLKYIDPGYAIRSAPAIPHDSAFTLLLGQNAVHAGMTGRTDMVVGFWNHQFTHVPIALAVSARKRIDPEGTLWSSVLASTGQPHNLC